MAKNRLAPPYFRVSTGLIPSQEVPIYGMILRQDVRGNHRHKTLGIRMLQLPLPC